MSNQNTLNNALIESSKQGDFQQVRTLIEEGVSPNFSDIPSFLWAYLEGHKNLVKYLLEQGGDVNKNTFNEGVILGFAASHDDVEFTKYLIAHGADVNHAMPRCGKTPLHNAVEANQSVSVKLLIAHGADVNRRAKTGPSDTGFGDFHGETPLHVAAARASVEIIQALLEHGADKTIRNFDEMSPYDFAIKYERPHNICQLLCLQEPQLEEGSYIDEKGRTRWHGNDEIALRLLELHTFLIISGYPEQHASRYPWLAHAISRFPESVHGLLEQGRLQEEIPGLGETMETVIREFLHTGTSAKLEECIFDTPRTVAELVPIPGLGAKTIKRLYEERGIDGLVSLRKAIDEGRLKGFRGIGKKTLEKIETYLDNAL